MSYLREAPVIRPASAGAVEVPFKPPPMHRQAVAVAHGAAGTLVQHGIAATLHRPNAMTGPPHTWSTARGWNWAEMPENFGEAHAVALVFAREDQRN